MSKLESTGTKNDIHFDSSGDYEAYINKQDTPSLSIVCLLISICAVFQAVSNLYDDELR